VKPRTGVFLICIGSELLKGEVLNTNLVFLGRVLFENGIKLIGERSVPDDSKQIHSALREALEVTDFVITSGGLGPTFDDITRQTLLDYFLGAKEFRIPNRVGKAPGILFQTSDRKVISLPGVPREFEAMIMKEVLPKHLLKIAEKKQSFTAKAIGISEVDFLKRLGRLPSQAEAECGIYPSLGEVRFTAAGKNVQKFEAQVAKKLKKFLYSFDRTASFEATLGKMMRKKKATVSIAESCTGGLTAKLITDIPGSSKYFLGGITAYSNQVKESFVGVSKFLIKDRGAVSKDVAAELAWNIRKLMGSRYGIGITGIAGPDGGTKQKPVGLVYIALSDSKSTHVQKFQFTGDRERIRVLAAKRALYLLWHKIKFGRF